MATSEPIQDKKPIHKLENMADLAQLTREEREYYHIDLDTYRTNLAVLEHERNEGFAEGYAEGRAEARAEVRKAMIRALKENGVSVSLIADILDIPESETEEL